MEIMFRQLKETFMTMIDQIEDINNEIETIKNN